MEVRSKKVLIYYIIVEYPIQFFALYNLAMNMIIIKKVNGILVCYFFSNSETRSV